MMTAGYVPLFFPAFQEPAFSARRKSPAVTALLVLVVLLALAWGAWGGEEHPVAGTPHLGAGLALALLALLGAWAVWGVL